MTGESRHRAGMRDPEGSSIAQRAAAILRQEVADGALANIATSSTMWPTAPRDLTAMLSRARTEVNDFATTVLDMLTNRPTPRQLLGIAAPYSEPAVTRAPTELRARLRNDSQRLAIMSFDCSDLVADSGQRIPSACVVLSPSELQLLPGDEVDMRIRLHVPANAAPGLYRGLIRATNGNGPRASVQFLVA